nr:LacI family DNA-binding transcriptional regulator [Bifidobacterium longum]
MAFVTLKDVAQRAGVSAAAVSQILHNKGRFSSDTRQLVLKTVEEMGYVPDQRARSMRSSDTKTVGLLVPDLRNPYFVSKCIKAMAAVWAGLRPRITVSSTRMSPMTRKLGP